MNLRQKLLSLRDKLEQSSVMRAVNPVVQKSIIWTIDKGIPAVKQGVDVSVGWTKTVVVPAVHRASTTAIAGVDGFCGRVVDKEVAFLSEHRGIAMFLSQKTVVRAAVYRHSNGMLDALHRSSVDDGAISTDVVS